MFDFPVRRVSFPSPAARAGPATFHSLSPEVRHRHKSLLFGVMDLARISDRRSARSSGAGCRVREVLDRKSLFSLSVNVFNACVYRIWSFLLESIFARYVLTDDSCKLVERKGMRLGYIKVTENLGRT